MIHKFVLERCIHCNLPLEALERSGWECNGHSTPSTEEDPLWDLDSPLPDFAANRSYPSPAKVHGRDHERFPSRPADELIREDLSPYGQRETVPSQNPKTDIFAVICFSTGMLGIVILPLIFTPVAFISGVISYYRLRDNPALKGRGLRLTGAILASLSILWLLFQFHFSDRQ